MTYTDAARARLAMSVEACDLSDLARAMVPIDATGTVLPDAARVLVAARRFLDAAVVADRVAGTSWQLVGGALGLSASQARRRFEAAEIRFRHRLRSPDADGGWRAYLLREPLEAAEDLDEWVGGTAPVSGGLERAVTRGEAPRGSGRPGPPATAP